MNAKKRFDETMKRCDALIALANKGRGNDDCLRMAIVLAVSAMERYVKDRFRQSLAKYCRQNAGSFNEALKQRLAQAGVDDSFWNLKAICPQKKPLKTVLNKVSRHLGTFAIQSATSIDELYLCYGLRDLTANVERKTGLKTVRASIRLMVRRRHGIAHGSDYLVSGKLDAIDAKEVTLRLDRLSRFIAAMDEILASKFAPRKRKRGVAKRPIVQSRSL